jgi:hypothetical protein
MWLLAALRGHVPVLYYHMRISVLRVTGTYILFLEQKQNLERF